MGISERLKQMVENKNQSTIFNQPMLEKAKKDFFELGMPTVKHEEWRFTPLSGVLIDDMHIDGGVKASYVDPLHTHDLIDGHLKEILDGLKGDPKGAYRLVIRSGNIAQDLCYLPNKDVCEVSYISEDNNSLAWVGSIAQSDKHFFTALNTALAEDGISIRIKAGKQLEMPLHIIHVEAAHQPTFAQRRIFIHLEKNASAEIIETYVTDRAKATHQTINAVYEILLDENAHCHHHDIQKSGDGFHLIQRTVVKQALHSTYNNYVFNLPGGKFFRNNLEVHIDAVDTSCHLYGLYLTANNQLVDHHTEVHHKYPNCESNQLYKGVLLDESKAVFNGKIFVYKNAQKTNAFQKSANLLLSQKALVNAKPQLEIFADDVKCSHGSTVGQLDEQSLFYLRSRGIGEATARQMLVNAFAFDVSQQVNNLALRHYLENEIVAAIQ